MILTTLIAAATLGVLPQQAPPALACPVMGSPTNDKSMALDYDGARFRMCCGGCDTTFKKDAASIVAKLKADSKTIGEFLFDPTTGKPIDAKKAKASSDYMGIRYDFESAENKAKFDKNPKMYASMPKKEVLSCVVMNHPVESYAKAGAYADHDGVRYYFCCTDCLAAFKADPDKFAKAAKSKVTDPSVQAVKQSN